MNKYYLNKNDIFKKLNYLLKESNLSLYDIQFFSLRKIYKLLKMLSKFDDKYKLPRKKLKQIAIALFEYVNLNSVNNEIEVLINLEIKENFVSKVISSFTLIISSFVEYFFDKKQIIRY